MLGVMNPSAAAILRHLQTADMCGIKRDGCVRRIKTAPAVARRLEESLLGIVCAESWSFVHYDDEPPTEGLLAASERIHPGVWRIPQGSSGHVLPEWLYMGNWQLYLAAGPLNSIPDLARESTAAAESFARKNRVSLMIDSFHDAVSWTVIIPHDA